MATKKAAGDYLKKLSTDHTAREEHKRDPQGAMTKAGLPPDSIAVIKTGDAEAIRKHLGDDAPPGCFLLF
jgi:hypothetical protein